MPDTRTLHSSRPVSGTPVDVVTEVGRVSARTVVGSSLEQELVLEVGSDTAGRRVRLGLGAPVTVYWSLEEGPVRSRPYEVVDIRGGGVPTWRLRPAGPAGEGERRTSPRAPIHLPVGLSMPSGLLLGHTADLSEGGLRAIFPVEPTSGFGDVVHPLPEAGERAVLTVVLDGNRVELRCRVVHRSRLPDGRRSLRVAFEDLDRPVRSALRIATALELGRRASR